MIDRTVYHVIKDGDEWEAKKEGSDRASFRARTKEDVLNKTIEFAKNQEPSQVIVHKTDGTIQEERTYPRSSDPARTPA